MEIRFGFNFSFVHLHHKLATKKAVVKDVEFAEFTENNLRLRIRDWRWNHLLLQSDEMVNL